ncbi:A-type carbonic anhydrase OS=Blastopirellula marina DSM 3645 GN=DSM3645_10202 PE=4 SV=1: Carb_anhydrase [Gemmata massiliana]|uniref:carbonic anhydrase n=1 Tax=Gemmata massiliana TaxID=1210884 RepID=A0A6P2CYW7_9BACT|nr:carbonic anhydrase family protein [Gemmata massiliana]VTR94328.1 A-type carbonic anhydrase OS=Blastopirellula marina DSM 3645 GN=DSM3645_10202 PE=4 SV=1: Carb_anhydrase [Gemmata massiliana]
MPVIGTQQSPIKIESVKAIYAPFGNKHLVFNYSRSLRGQIDGVKHNFVFDRPGNENSAPEWSITAGGETWLIRQIHMHAPAEHLIDSDSAKPFEVHLVHSRPGDPTAAGDKLVVGVFIQPGAETRKKESLEKFLDAQAKRSPGSTEPTEVDPRDFLPDSGLDQFFRYEGSLTGEPYTEDVSWYVMRNDGVVDPKKFEALEKYAEHHARVIQFLNRRFVLKSFDK